MRPTKLIFGVWFLAVIIGGGCTNDPATIAVSDPPANSDGPLRPGKYNGTMICDGGWLYDQYGIPTTYLVSMVVTDEGWPATEGGLEISPGTDVTLPLANFGNVDLRVKNYETGEGRFTAELEGYTVTCDNSCIGSAKDGVCNEEGACPEGEYFCIINGEYGWGGCSPGTDCDDCRGVLPMMESNVTMNVEYVQESPSSLTENRKIVSKPNRSSPITIACGSILVKDPSSH